MIGLYGPVLFHSGTTGLTTFDAMKKTVTARWGVHEVWLDKPVLEYAGPKLIEISFTMELIKPYTTDPLGMIFLLEETMDLAIPYPLVIGLKPMGRGMSLFVLTSLSHEMKYFYRDGGLMGASVEVQLKEYPNISINSLVQALGGVFGNAPASDVQAGALDSSMTSADSSATAALQNTVTPSVAQTGAYSLPPSYGIPAETPANVYVPPTG